MLSEIEIAEQQNAKLHDELEVATARIANLEAQVEAERDRTRAARAVLGQVMRQNEQDLKGAHAELCKLQGIDPETHSWPDWSPQANSLRWFETIRAEFSLNPRLRPENDVRVEPETQDAPHQVPKA